MPEEERRYRYVAISDAGARTKGEVKAPSETAAFEALRRQGLSPISLVATIGRPPPTGGPAAPAPVAPSPPLSATAKPLPDALVAELLASLGALLRAGADIRTALSILGDKSNQPAVRAFCTRLSAEVSGGSGVETALTGILAKRQQFAAALAAAGQASGDLAGGFERAAAILKTRIRIREQLTSALSYPAFVFVSAVISVLVILLFIVPALAPLAQDNGAKPPLSLAIMIATSNFLRANGGVILAGLGGLGLAGGFAFRFNLFDEALDRALLRGPFGRTACGLVYGGYALSLGSMLQAGAPITEALILSARTVRSPIATKALSTLSQKVRQGAAISEALAKVPGMPSALPRLAAVGEASGALGAMLVRAGEIEETGAIKRIERWGGVLGPALIVLLGGLIGLLMAGLLSGVSQLGEGVLQ